MKIKDLLRALASRFKISDLVDRIRGLRKTIKEVDIPLWASASKDLKRLAHPDAKKFEDSVNRGCKGVYRGAMVEGIYDAIKNAQLILDYLEELVSTEFDHFNQQVAKDGLTFRKAQIIQYVGVVEYLMSYSRKLVELLAVLETIQRDPNSQRLEDAFTPADLEEIDKGREAFINAIKLSSYDIKDLSAAFASIPDALASEESERVMESTAGMAAIDPVGLRNFVVPSHKNPLYVVQLWIAEFQVWLYDRAVSQKHLVELRLLKLREAAKANPNPKLDEQIAYQEKRLDELNRKIREKEQLYA